MNPLLAIALSLLILGLWLSVRLVRAGQARAVAHAAYFDAVQPLFTEVTRTIQPTGFVRLSGRRHGLRFDLQVIPDTLTFRKLPALWVLVSLPEPLPGLATVDMMARPTGNETFSPFGALGHSLPPLPGLPPEVAIRCDDRHRLPAARVLADHSDLFADPRVKELLITDRGLRIVILAEEADRGRFLIFRDAEMGMIPLPSDRLDPLIDRLRALRRDLTAMETT
jgi:hypothetical protein